MKESRFVVFLVTLVVCVALPVNVAFAGSEEGKAPLTTSSQKALKYYLQGRDLAEKLRGQESIQHFQKAVAEDPDFAIAHLNLAFVLPSAKQFFETFGRARALADKVSDAEKWWILGIEAGISGDPARQREFYKKLVKAYPDDERAHNLLANNYFGQQEYESAIKEYSRAVQINPEFSQPYNQLGYAYRFLERYEEAEKAFEKYIKLIPDDPNPYDSYAELLMKIGKFDASIEYYQKALDVNPNFVASHIGIATNLNLKGDHEGARKQLKILYGQALNDGQRRAALAATAVSYVDEGNMGKALEQLQKQYAIAEAIDDAAAMSGDLVLMGNVLLEAGKPDKALKKFDEAVKVMEASSLEEPVKDQTRLGYLYNSARIYLAQGDFEKAKKIASKYKSRAKAVSNPNQMRLSHQLAGMIALKEADFDRAIQELKMANQQNPYNFYRIARAREGKGESKKARKLYQKAAEFNALNSFPYAFIRLKARQMIASL